ncbi:MAG: hypothetical protein OXG38_08745 [Chloroflexi bacterium]|nr:hypothetical protein [Chloroflexota bacterium]
MGTGPRRQVSIYTDFLYARPSFLEGCARVFDFANSLSVYNTSIDPEASDKRALWADWHAIGDDLRAAMGELPATSRER